MSEKICVLFPGIKYSCDKPLLYYAGNKYEDMGYRIIELQYRSGFNTDETLEEKSKKVCVDMLEQLGDINWKDCDDIVFISKSIGTVAAGYAEEQLRIECTQIYMTPLEPTLRYITGEHKIKIVIAGDQDKYLDGNILMEHCEEHDVELLQIEGVGHRLEVKGDVESSIEILDEIIKAI